ncbi:MAG TPA: alpha-glucosidase [Cyclobacteriaceae bacterium]|jgi:oligo-1,6-glucosidase|nr:alpha-glucosidase [Cyclobacteriaceae bacterium]
MSWHKRAVIYQIYPRSFYDSNNDGVGDLQGVIAKLDYIQSLGVDAVWLNPIYKSPNEDGGYDVSDFYSIQPELGTMEDFHQLVAGLHLRNMKLIMDMVLNHSSDEHPWFQQSRLSKENEFRDFYFWLPGKNGGPPNNWKSFFSGSAWQLDGATNEYYLHLFSGKQPDLNWDLPTVREEMKKIMRFWANKGVDALRLDVITTISKRPGFPNSDQTDFNDTIRKVYANGPRLKEFVAELRRDVFDPAQMVTVGEGPGISPQNALEYLDNEKGLSMIFHFGHMFLDQGSGGRFDPRKWSVEEFKRIFEEWDRAFAKQGWGAVFLGNHDFARMVSRWGNDKEYHVQSSKLLITLLLAMRGTPFIFQGDEIGMTNLILSSVNQSRDFETINGWRTAQKNGKSEKEFLENINYAGRDNARTPFQWNDQANAGFSSVPPWMMVNPNHTTINAAAQENDRDSILNYFRAMVRIRKNSIPLTEGQYTTIECQEKNLYVFERQSDREKMIIILNLSSHELEWPLDLTNHEKIIGNYEERHPRIRPWEAMIIKKSESR